ncbi:MAG: hypothetical protein KIS75_13685 [Chromatiales bacterium]|nr:hypothetical protein [Chromatiales bacterium]
MSNLINAPDGMDLAVTGAMELDVLLDTASAANGAGEAATTGTREGSIDRVQRCRSCEWPNGAPRSHAQEDGTFTLIDQGLPREGFLTILVVVVRDPSR